MSDVSSADNVRRLIENLPTAFLRDAAREVWTSTQNLRDPAIRAVAIDRAMHNKATLAAAVPAIRDVFKVMRSFADGLAPRAPGGGRLSKPAAAKPEVR